MTDTEFTIGPSKYNRYLVSADSVDISRRPSRKPLFCSFGAEPKNVKVDLGKTALLIVDMQNDFCTKGGMVSERGGAYRKLRKPIKPLQKLIPRLRKKGVPVVWVNWGNRPDKRNLAPGLLYTFNRTGDNGLGDSLSCRNSNILEKDSWSAAIVDELGPDKSDIFVDKCRVSGFWDTPLDSILRNQQLTTLLFAGVNADQCVMCTMQDASFLGYDTVLLRDCVATTSPDYCMKATLYNAKISGFVSSSVDLLASLTPVS